MIQRNVFPRCRYGHLWRPVSSTGKTSILKCARCGARLRTGAAHG